MGRELEVEGLSKSFETEQVLRDVTFSLDEGEVGTIVGPSGAGKTTLLNIIAGIVRADSGRVSIGGRLVESGSDDRNGGINTIPVERNVGYVFQDYLLFPNMTVFENVSFGLEARHLPKQDIRSRVKNVLEITGIHDIRERKPAQISGGQMQRAALARAIVLEPHLLLLDEPLSALDRQTRETLRLELKKIFGRLSVTALYVTHDLDEAFFLGDALGIMREGRLSFYESKSDLLTRMSSSEAGFLGFNLIKVEFIRSEESELVFLATEWGAQIRLALAARAELTPNQKTVIAVPPEAVKVQHPQNGSQPFISARIRELREFKDRIQIVMGEPGHDLISEISSTEFYQLALQPGYTIQVTIESGVIVSDGS
ncbi:MAG: ABC transporter ATP-binding protein [Thaumarchaeota archaeon]|nr:ABC transporter ATP-binding protein [Nitrososphaerota archaeon]